MFEISPESKMRSTDRVFKFEKIETDKSIRNSTGLVDPTLFKGDNRLRCVMDQETSLWSFKQDHGSVPPALKGNWTGYQKAVDYAKTYYAGRNVRITAV